MANVTNHELVVSTVAGNEYVPPCGLDRCGKIGFGVLQIEQSDDQATAELEFTGARCGAGCEVLVDAKDLGVVEDYTCTIPPTGEAEKIAVITAKSRLGLAVDALPMKSAIQPQLFFRRSLQPTDS
jgi:hypothetical protein